VNQTGEWKTATGLGTGKEGNVSDCKAVVGEKRINKKERGNMTVYVCNLPQFLKAGYHDARSSTYHISNQILFATASSEELPWPRWLGRRLKANHEGTRNVEGKLV